MCYMMASALVAAFKARTCHTRAPALVHALQRVAIGLNHNFKKVTTLNQDLTHDVEM